jgi:hypothetical protein
MAHFAKVNGGLVEQVVVVHNNDAPDEAAGIAFLLSLFGPIAPAAWVQTSYNGSVRKNFAGVGFTYDAGRDAFIPPKPFPSWLLDEATCRWQAPVAMPESGGPWQWDEGAGEWVQR